ncbi:hypothetical protein C0991_001370 [Blastosporella zonata]|nr:hypothetical protein C0991_001370 [Blastosporella zonata]
MASASTKPARSSGAQILFSVLIRYSDSMLSSTKPRAWMIFINMSIIVLLFLMALTLLSLDISNFITEINATFINGPDVALGDRYKGASGAIFRRVVVIDAIYGYMTVLGDAIIVWRVYAFWGKGERRWLLLLLCAMLLGSAITTFLLTYCVAALGTELFLGGFQKPLFCRNIQITSYAMPAATTFVATTLIGITAWEYRRSVKPGLSSVSRRTRVEKILLLLVESGFMYFLFFLYTVLCNNPTIARAIRAREDLSFTNQVVTFSASIIVGCYPTLIIILAHSKHTALETTVSESLPTLHAVEGQTITFSGSGSADSIGRARKAREED